MKIRRKHALCEGSECFFGEIITYIRARKGQIQNRWRHIQRDRTASLVLPDKRVMSSSQLQDLCAQVLELAKLIPDLSAQLLDLRKRHINDFVKPNEQNSSSLEYSAMARIFVQASAIELAHIAERNRKCQKKIALLRTFSYPELQ